ncbi:hypothetical protein I79_005795 [Cricetulus griseus]|uniref:Uncharacterized protein n=1 Tax=Cricetulus griseus TaxID=10029 RepID=G3H644_CRIGR|nr:hypothetical protein I79_005795 [Cricetulus griseus]
MLRLEGTVTAIWPHDAFDFGSQFTLDNWMFSENAHRCYTNYIQSKRPSPTSIRYTYIQEVLV